MDVLVSCVVEPVAVPGVLRYYIWWAAVFAVVSRLPGFCDHAVEFVCDI